MSTRQKIELILDGKVTIFCPFCGHHVINVSGPFSECEHTLFVATNDSGFEYVSPEIKVNEDFEVENEYMRMDEYFETLEHPYSVCFEISHFSGYSVFVGFGRK